MLIHSKNITSAIRHVFDACDGMCAFCLQEALETPMFGTHSCLMGPNCPICSDKSPVVNQRVPVWED